MIRAYTTSTGERPDILGKGLKIIDIGGANSFAHGHLDAVVDIRQPQAGANHYFIGDICEDDVWAQLFRHVAKHGRWDYAICTHTLEDLTNPTFAANRISMIAKAGVCITPSKYREFTRFQDTGARGFMHHFWIFDILDGVYTCWPKHNFIENSRFNSISNGLPNNEELIVEWQDEIGLQQINNGQPFGTATLSGEQHMQELYTRLI